jgi:16S rRNA (adenine1518-N6/adenine1519-N6)-dimethyltransferase
MATLGIPSNTIAILQKHNIRIQKKYGQNFLIDRHILEKIVSAAEITKADLVLEIGPGIGTMTQYLAEAAGKVIAVEIDRALIPVLQDTLADYDNVVIINDDVLKTDLVALLATHSDGRPVKVVANLPYYITTPIIMGLFEQALPLSSITVMVQKEVAQRMQVGPGTKDYGALSLAVQYYAKPELITMVQPGCFIPRPAVESAVIRLTKHERPPVTADEQLLFGIIRASFNQRRKTLANGLANADHLHLTRERVVDGLKKMGLNAEVRGETLTLEQFAELAEIIAHQDNR